MEESAARELLGAQRQATLTRISALTDDFEGIVATSSCSNLDDEHDPEGATVAFERAQVTALLDGARAHLDDLDRALARLAAGAYWVCERCSVPITSERLRARPAIRTCIRCAAARSPRLRKQPNRPPASENE